MFSHINAEVRSIKFCCTVCSLLVVVLLNYNHQDVLFKLVLASLECSHSSFNMCCFLNHCNCKILRKSNYKVISYPLVMLCYSNTISELNAFTYKVTQFTIHYSFFLSFFSKESCPCFGSSGQTVTNCHEV